MYIDIHAHLDDFRLESQREKILQEFFSYEKSQLITTVDPYNEISVQIARNILALFPRLWVTVAAHPHQAKEYSPSVEKRIDSLLSHPQMIAIGEAGLDYHYNFSPPEDQKRVFTRQIAIAAEHKLPLLVHSREAEKDILSILEKEKFPYPVLFHCFTGKEEEAREILRRGYYLSFSGIITFKNASGLREILRHSPLNQLFLETDSPYLAPEPHRGKINSPLMIPLIYEYTAKLLNLEINAWQRIIADNFSLFNPKFQQ